MKYLVTLAAVLAFSASALAQTVISNGTSSTIISRDGSTVSSSTSSGGGAGSVILDNQSSVTSSTTINGTGTTSHSISGRTGSMCGTTYQGQRCEISCQAPQVAQCGTPAYAGGSACYCQ